MGKGVKREKDRTRTQMKGEEQSKVVCLHCPHPLCEFLTLSFLPTKSPELHHYSSRSQASIFKCYYFISSNSALKSLKAVQRSYPNSLHGYKGLSGIASCSCQAEPGFLNTKQGKRNKYGGHQNGKLSL